MVTKHAPPAIPGTGNPEHPAANVVAAALRLSDEAMVLFGA